MSDGRIVLGGYSILDARQDLSVVRLLSTGTLDTSFGSGGEVIIAGRQIEGGTGGGAGQVSLEVQPDGRVLIAGTGTATTGDPRASLNIVRLNVDGTLDTSFENAGFLSCAENTKTVTTLAVTDALLGTAPKFTLSGLDASLFKVSSKGVLTFTSVKDYEQPVDTNKDGVYEVSVTLTNAKTGYRVVRDLTVGVEFVPIDGTVGTDNLKGTAGWDTLDGLAGDDKITGGFGLDTFLISSGRDTILDFNALTKGATGSEILKVSAGATADATLKAAWTATNDSFNEGTANLTTKGMAVDLSGITQGLGWNVTNAGAAATIKGTQFNDRLTGGSGNDTLDGGAGSDYLSGGSGNDTYVFGRGYGQDTAYDYDTTAGNVDTVQLGAGIAAADVLVTRDDYSLYLSLVGTTDKLTLSNWFTNRIEQVRFADGTVWDAAILIAKAGGSSGNDYLVGTTGADTLVGLAGNDTCSLCGRAPALRQSRLLPAARRLQQQSTRSSSSSRRRTASGMA
jgi:uncharacterized delta-60 repeat protein